MRCFFACLVSLLSVAASATEAPEGMVWIDGGEFVMGTDNPMSMPNERPAHTVRLSGFWIDATPVTNDQFREFIDATGYVTTAERPIDWEELKKQVPPGTPKPPDEVLQPGSLVFTPPSHAVPFNNLAAWWSWTIGANWRRPEGPESSIDDRGDHPVVQVSWDDASAYAEWAGKQLPTEAQWEYAAWGGKPGTRYYWGDSLKVDGEHVVNTFTGKFPHENLAEDGYAATSPVKAFPPNGYGLYDMAGNAWDWTADRYRHDRHARLKSKGVVVDPPSPLKTFDPTDPLAERRVIKGGSFLCHVDYCESYRPTARRGTPTDTGSAHVGFRCVLVEIEPKEE